MNKAEDSPHLDRVEKAQAAEHSAPQALVIHEVVRGEGDALLERTSMAVAWSGLAAGLSMGFSFLGLALMQSALPEAPWSRLVDSVGYTLGFLITILGRQELYTESTLTAMLPVLVERNRRTLIAALRFWAVVLLANLCGTFLFAGFISPQGMFAPAVRSALDAIAHQAVSGAFWPTFAKAVLAGWLIALMAWLLPSARSARMFIIMLLTYFVAVGRFSHIVAGSVDSAFALWTGAASVRDYLVGFLVPTLLGNTLGGVSLVALLNHAPLADELRGGEENAQRPAAQRSGSQDRKPAGTGKRRNPAARARTGEGKGA